jgi:hypothetical protein
MKVIVPVENTKTLFACLYNPYCFSEQTVFFSHNKSVNSTFSHDLLAKRLGLPIVAPTITLLGAS